MNLFSVSNVPHLYLSQFIAYEAKQRGERNLLLLWTNMDDDGPIRSCRAMLISELWDEVVEVPLSVTQGYHIRNAFPMPNNLNPVRAARAAVPAQAYLKRFIYKYLAELSSVTVHNLRNPLDRFVALHANHHRIELNYLEDGFNAYLNQAFKPERQRGVRHALVRACRKGFFRLTGLDGRALASADGIFDPLFKFSRYFVVFPEALSEIPESKKVDLRKMMPTALVSEFQRKYHLPETLKRIRTPTLFLGRADSEDGLMDQHSEIELTVELLKLLVMKTDQCIFYKPHPRDRKEKIESILSQVPEIQLLELKTKLPIEILAPLLGVENCLCFWSVPQIYLNAFYSIPTYGFMPWAVVRLRQRGELNPRYEEICSTLRKLFPSQTRWVSNVDTFKHIK